MLRIATMTLLCLTLFASIASAAIEITPMAGYRVGGSLDLKELNEDGTETVTTIDFVDGSSRAIAINLNIQDDKQIELFWSHKKSELGERDAAEKIDLDIDYIHIGGTVLYPQHDFPLVPYIVGGLGATIFSPESDDLESETRFSLSLGGGLRYFPLEHIGLRAEGRAYGTFFSDNSALFCRNGNCKVYMDGDAIFQFEGLAGLIVRF